MSTSDPLRGIWPMGRGLGRVVWPGAAPDPLTQESPRLDHPPAPRGGAGCRRAVLSPVIGPEQGQEDVEGVCRTSGGGCRWSPGMSPAPVSRSELQWPPARGPRGSPPHCTSQPLRRLPWVLPFLEALSLRARPSCLPGAQPPVLGAGRSGWLQSWLLGPPGHFVGC